MERMIWIFISREGMVLRGEKAPSNPALCGGEGGVTQRLYGALEKVHIAMADMTLRDHVERSLAIGRYQITLNELPWAQYVPI